MSKVSVSTKLLRGKHIPTIQRIMEISKSLQEEILSVQNKLKNAIRDHQICVDKLKDDPDNTNVLDQIQQIQIYIVSLGRRQKQVVQRLRTEVETLKAESANGSKVSVASLLGLNNNNHIINNNARNGESTDSKDHKNINILGGIIKKEDYEEEIRNDDSSPSQENDCSNRERSNSVESISYEDDVVEISADENSNEKQDMEEECGIESSMQVSFLGTLGLITTTMSIELQSRKAERKRRRTANHQFVYSNWELSTKRKRYSYLQSAGKAPQTRQSAARSIGPSPTPQQSGKILANKSLPPSTKNSSSSKTLISTQKVIAKPNILRNGVENKTVTKNGNENNAQSQNNKALGSKVVHIPGLPSSLTIERIEADSAICISCRNPGTLTICQQCSSKYHISCHTVSPPPPKICPACALNLKDSPSFTGVICKKENELEEKERERYELRERNSELRLQVYELEKRSQLLSQSLQLQRRTRQEVLGKQEKTQKSIKRLVDFIKLMQLQKETSCPQISESTSCHRPPISSQSPQVQCPSPITQQSKIPHKSIEPTHQKSDSSTNSPTRETSPSSITKTNSICQIIPPIKNHQHHPIPINSNHTTSLKKSPNQRITMEVEEEEEPEEEEDKTMEKLEIKTTQSLIINCQAHVATVQHTVSPKCHSPNHQIPSSAIKSSVVAEQNQVVTLLPVENQTTLEAYPVSIESMCPTTDNMDSIVHRPTKTIHMTKTYQDSVTYSTHCSQSITSPISSPVVQVNHKETQQIEQTTQTFGNILKSKTQNFMTEQTSPQIIPNT